MPRKSLAVKFPLEIFLLFLASLLFLLVSLSTPVIQHIYLFGLSVSVDAKVAKSSGQALFGVWGYCTSGVSSTVGIGPLSKTTTSSASCSPAHLGWTFQGVPGFSGIDDAISHGLTGFFVFHLIVCFFIICATIFSAVVLLQSRPRRSAAGSDNAELDNAEPENVSPDDAGSENSIEKYRKPRRLTLFAAFLVTFIFLFDFAVFGVTKDKVHSKSNGSAILSAGPALWLILVAALFIWFAVFLGLSDLRRNWGGEQQDLSPRAYDPSSENQTEPKSPHSAEDIDQTGQDEQAERHYSVDMSDSRHNESTSSFHEVPLDDNRTQSMWDDRRYTHHDQSLREGHF